MSAVAWDVDGAEHMPRRRAELVAVPSLPARGSRSTQPTRSVRLRRTVAAVVLALALAVGWAIGAEGRAEAPKDITVRPGQTLSEIAAVELPEMSLNDGVVHLQVANNLASSHVTAGQHLLVPR